MISKISSRFIDFVDAGEIRKSRERMELVVDTVSELPSVEFEGIVLAHGSTAYIVTTGQIYVLAGDGKWYDKDDGSTPAAATLNTASPAAVRPQTQLSNAMTEPEEVSDNAEPVRTSESE